MVALESDAQNHGREPEEVIAVHVRDENAIQLVAPDPVHVQNALVLAPHTPSLCHLVEDAHLSIRAYT